MTAKRSNFNNPDANQGHGAANNIITNHEVVELNLPVLPFFFLVVVLADSGKNPINMVSKLL
jgi:hypothetical protein